MCGGRILQEKRGMTFIEVVVVTAILAVLAAMLLPALLPARRVSSRIGCVNNLKEIALAGKIWAGDNNDRWPQSLSVTNGGARELLESGKVAGYFQVESNELSTPKILTCPNDRERTVAQRFEELTNTNISYFVSLNQEDGFPQSIILGDDDFVVNGVRVKSGVVNLCTNHNVKWSGTRHVKGGNVVLADGSAAMIGNSTLTNSAAWGAPGTNLIAIP